jgi:hypothetical protein
VGSDSGTRPLGDPAPHLPDDGRADRPAGRGDDPGVGQAAGGGPGRGRLRRRPDPLVRRGGRPPRRRPRALAGRRGPQHPAEAARGPVPADRPVELPTGHGRTQGRARDRRRMHQHPQARPADPAVLARADAVACRRRPAAGSTKCPAHQPGRRDRGAAARQRPGKDKAAEGPWHAA